jgi:sulfoxide reductase heme-binding subunit YedZ
MATGYVGLALVATALALGPISTLRGRPFPVSTDLRRDIGLWAGAMAVAHTAVGSQVHMKHIWLYLLKEAESTGALVPRADLFGLANYVGLLGTMVALVLLATSNDWSLRRLGARKWKSVQRGSYVLGIAIALHGLGYQVMERRGATFVLVFALAVMAAAGLQVAGYRRRRAPKP